MAEIKGLTIKGLTRFIGMEGEAFQGNIYLNGKKIGWYSESGDGGCSTFRYDSREDEAKVEAIIKKYFEEKPPLAEYLASEEIFFADLVDLINHEKAFKKGLSKGYAWYVTAKCVFNPDAAPRPYEHPIVCNIPSCLTSDKEMEKFLGDLKERGYDEIKVYRSLDDFIVK